MEDNPKKQGKSLSIKGLTSHTNNPFLDDLKSLACIEPRLKYGRVNKELADVDTGEYYTIPMSTGDEHYFWKDGCSFVKLYLGENNLKDIATLSKPALWLLAFIIDHLRPNSDVVTVSPAQYIEYSKSSNKVAYYQAVVELEQKRFIAKINNGAFYINVTKFMNGVRTELLGSAENAYYTKNRRKIKPNEEKENQEINPYRRIQ